MREKINLDRIRLTRAECDDVVKIRNLINLAYRGEQGWTRETEIISGDRVKDHDLREILSNTDSHLLVCHLDGELISCICVDRKQDRSFIGMFAVHPEYQGLGLGKKVLSLAEEFASHKLDAKIYVMLVVSQRSELVSYYERRGYVRIGKYDEYPTHLDVGMPRVDGLTIEYLEKKASC